MDNKTIIMLHGLFSNRKEWEAFSIFFKSHNYNVQTQDLFGHGTAEKSQDVHKYTSQHQIKYIVNWFERLELEYPVIIIGHSFGGYLALHLAKKYPNKVDKVIVINPMYRFEQLSFIHNTLFSFPAFFTWCGKLLIRSIKIFRGDQVKDIIEKVPHPNFFYILKDFNDQELNLDQIEQKTLIIWGEDDRTLAPTSFEYLRKKILNAQELVIKDCGHVPHQDKPDFIQKAILSFIK